MKLFNRLSASSCASFSLLWLSIILAFVVSLTSSARSDPKDWQEEWPDTDFTQNLVEWDEIVEGGPPKDGILAITRPRFARLGETFPLKLGEEEPVIAFERNGDARAYPLRMLMPHEIVNDIVGGVPVVVTYCPLCNTAIVFERVQGDQTLSFGTSGKLRHSDLIMYDRQTQSWWQQYTGEAIVGEMTGTTLKPLPSRLESLESFRSRYPSGRILLPLYSDPEAYTNPYERYDRRKRPLPLFEGESPKGISAMARVIAVDDRAWSLELLREKQTISQDDLVLSWTSGQNSALDKKDISKGRDVGNVVVQRNTPDGPEDVPYYVTFAFVFHAFHPESTIATE